MPNTLTETSAKMSTISPVGNVPGLLRNLMEKYINPTNLKSYLEAQKSIVSAPTTSFNLEAIASDALKTEMMVSGSDLRLRELVNLLSVNLPVNIDRLALETSYIEILQNTNKAQMKEYGPASKLGLKEIEDALAGMDGLQKMSAYTQEICMQIENLIYPILMSNPDPMYTQQWLNFLANIEFMMVSTQILSDLSRRANELKPTVKALRRDSNMQTGYVKPEWLEGIANTANNTQRERMMQTEAVRNYIGTAILNASVYQGFNPDFLYNNLIDLSDEALKYLYMLTQNSGFITASDSDIMKKLAVGTHVIIYYNQCTNNILNTLPPTVQSMLAIISSAHSFDPNYVMTALCKILGLSPLQYPTNPLYNPGAGYMFYLSLIENNPNIFFGHLLIENRSSDLFELSKRLIGSDGTKTAVFNINDLQYLQQQAANVGNMYKTPQGVTQYLSQKGALSTSQAFTEMSEIICSCVAG